MCFFWVLAQLKKIVLPVLHVLHQNEITAGWQVPQKNLSLKINSPYCTVQYQYQMDRLQKVEFPSTLMICYSIAEQNMIIFYERPNFFAISRQFWLILPNRFCQDLATLCYKHMKIKKICKGPNFWLTRALGHCTQRYLKLPSHQESQP
jgi:hypothetical protein